jgi:thiamine biosynthesis lipoprotein
MLSASAKIFLFLCALQATACGRSSAELAELVLSGPTMGTTYTVKVVAPPASLDSARLRATIDETLARIDRSMSGYRADSEVARFNASRSTEWREVSAELATVVQTALAVSEKSGGAFDITIAPLVDAWGFGPGGRPRDLPNTEQLAQIGASVGFRKLHVRADPAALRKDVAELAIDLNGVAPGFAVDLLADRLRALRVEHFVIDIGGEVRALGRNARGEPWRIAIEHPVDTQRTPYAAVQLDGASVSTSGEYRDYYERDGHRYSHTIDPRTARPLDRAPGSVVVVASSTALADGWATALNVLGPREGLALAAREHMPVLFVERDGEGWRAQSTPEFERYRSR